MPFTPDEQRALPDIFSAPRFATYLTARNGSRGEVLRERGHKVEFASLTPGVHIIKVMEDGMLMGGADPRREGVALCD